MKIKALILIMVIVSVVMNSAGQDRDRFGKPGKGKTLHVGIPFQPVVRYDPAKAGYVNLQPLFRSVYATLFKMDSQLRPYPFLLESYEKNGKTVTLVLKENARFSDGSFITAADVVKSIETVMRDSSYPALVRKVIQGGDAFALGRADHCTGIEVLGPKRFQVRLVDENIEFPYYLTSSMMSVIPRTQGVSPLNIKFSGAFRVVAVRESGKETQVTLKRNQWYIGKASKIETLVMHFYHRHEDFDAAIYLGKPQLFLYNLHHRMPESRYKYNYFKTPISGAFYLALNSGKGPFRDKKLRRFFKNFILAQEFQSNKEWQLTTPAKLLLPHSLPGYSVFSHMKGGKVEQRAPQEQITIRCLNTDTVIRKQLFPLLKEKLAEYNIRLDLRWGNWTNLEQQGRKGEYDLTSYYYMVDVPLSAYFYETLFTPWQELNIFGNEVPAALNLLESYRRETDELVKLKILSRLEEIAQEQSVVIPVMIPSSLVGYKRNVINVKVDKFLNINFEGIDVR
ncbi:MAG: ABC transporter substrate-binding protein [bacterium]|nr:ABC transporter substrate-binding protein [bacterium]